MTQIYPQNLDAVYRNAARQLAVAVAEPSSLMLLGTGGLAALACRRRHV